MKNFRWVIILLAFIATIINYLDRSAISYAIGPLKELFHLTDADFGLVGSAFGIGYILCTFLGGILVDRYGSRRVWSAAAIIWSISCGLLSIASGFITLFLFRVLMGLAEGPAFPALTRTATDWLPMGERSRALAIGLAAVPFSAVIGAPLLSHMIIHFGWQAMFIILGIAGVIWAIIWYVLYRDQAKDSPHVSAAELQHISAGSIANFKRKPTNWRFILLNKNLLVNNYAFFSFGYLLFFAVTWLPGYFEQTYHTNIKQTGWLLMLPWLLGTVLILICGFWSDKIWKKTGSLRKSRSQFIWICQIISALCLIAATMTSDVTTALLFISLGLGIGLMPNAAFYALNADLIKEHAATSLGVMDAAFALAGILAPLITGYLATITGNFKVAIYLMAILSISSGILVAIFQHPDRDIQKNV
jgi:MFS family permease